MTAPTTPITAVRARSFLPESSHWCVVPDVDSELGSAALDSNQDWILGGPSTRENIFSSMEMVKRFFVSDRLPGITNAIPRRLSPELRSEFSLSLISEAVFTRFLTAILKTTGASQIGNHYASHEDSVISILTPKLVRAGSSKSVRIPCTEFRRI